MKQRGILFSDEMVRAIIDGQKTQTRRVVKPQPSADTVGYSWCISTDRKRNATFIPRRTNGDYRNHHQHETGPPVRCPYGQPGDLLYVRECWSVPGAVIGSDDPIYKGMTVLYRATDKHHSWRPSIHMPKWAARIWLKVTEVRVERVRLVLERDAEAEGVSACYGDKCGYPAGEVAKAYRCSFERFWNSINAKRGYSWESNPWVWVVSFERCEAPTS